MGQMDMSQVEQLVDLQGARVVGSDGEWIGRVEQIWVDNVNHLPEWAEVSTGRLGGSSRYVPLRAADLGDGEIVVNYTKDEVDSAPAFEPTAGGRDAFEALYRHYGQPLPSPPPPQVRNPFDRLTATWVPGVREKAAAIAARFDKPDGG